MRVRLRRYAVVMPLMVLLVIFNAAETAGAEGILKRSGVRGGLAVVLGGDADLLAELHAGGPFLVHDLTAEPESVARLRAELQRRGLYGPISADCWNGEELPYAENLVRLLVACEGEELPRAEVMRVLCPGGVAMVEARGEWEKIVKPWPEEMDVWTHYFHDSGNNPVSHDELVAPPTQLRWIVQPMYYRSHSWNKTIVGMVTANGRTYHIEDRGPTGRLDLRFPEKWSVVCRDAFSGVELWNLPMGPKWGWREWEETGPKPFQQVARGPIAGLWAMPLPNNRRTVVDPERDVVFVTLEYRAPITVLDAASGEVINTFDGAGNVDEIVQAEDGTLIVRAREIAARETKYGARDPADMMKDFFPAKPDRVVAIDPDTGAVLWEREVGHLAPYTLAARNGRVACYNYRELICLDQKTGEKLWSAEAKPVSRKDKRSGTEYFQVRGAGSVMMRGDEVFLISGDGFQGYAADTGRMLWETRGGGIPTCFGVPRHAYMAAGLLWSAGLRGAEGTDPQTGEVVRQVDIGNMLVRGHHLRCHHSKATDRYLIANQRGAEFIDLQGDNHMVHDWIHGGCGHGVVPANGLLYDPPEPCQCYKGTKVPGFKAMAGGPPDLEDLPTAEQRLQKGLAYHWRADGQSPTDGPSGWPMYRHDPGRSGRSPVPVPSEVDVTWSADLGAPGTQPVVAGGRLYVAVPSRHRVDCLDVQDGERRWSFTADGPVDLPPTVVDGRVYFGGMDGRVYCLRADDGALCWSYLVAPKERRINALGRLESPWPVHGAVLVHEGTVYATAGRSTYLDGGIFAVALDAETGSLLHEARLDGPRPSVEELKEGVDRERYGSGLVMEGSLNDIFTLAGGRLFMLFQVFDRELSVVPTKAPGFAGQRDLEIPHLIPHGGYTDTSLFNREYWTYSRYWWYPEWRKLGSMCVFDDENVYALRLYNHGNYGHMKFHKLYTWAEATDPARLSAAPKDVPPRDDNPLSIKYPADNTPPLWEVDVPLFARAMVQAGDRVVIVGIPSAGLTPEEALRAVEGEGAATLWIASAEGGDKLGECTLPATCVFDGMSSAEGKVFLSTRDGKVRCFAGERQ